jgi:hypothetical protein
MVFEKDKKELSVKYLNKTKNKNTSGIIKKMGRGIQLM